MSYIIPERINCASTAAGFGISCPNCDTKFFIEAKDSKISLTDKTTVGAKCPSCKKKIKTQDFMELRKEDIDGIKFFYAKPDIIFDVKFWIPFGWVDDYEFFIYDRRICRKLGSELALDIFESMEFPISERDKVVILKKEENEVDC